METPSNSRSVTEGKTDDHMIERQPMPPVLWWIFGALAVCFIVWWGHAGLSQALWWLGLLIGTVAAAVVTLWIRDTLNYDSALYTLADVAIRLFWCAAAILFFFWLLVVGSIIVEPIWSSLIGPGGYPERYSGTYG